MLGKNVTQAKITRVVKGAAAGGIAPDRVTVGPDGTITVSSGTAPPPPLASPLSAWIDRNPARRA